MATDRKSFILHRDSLNVLDELDDKQAGLLFKAIKAYQNNEDIELDSITKIVMSPFKSQFERDEKKYNKIVERNKNNGLKGGRPKTQDNPKEPSGLSGLKKEPKKADSVSKSDSDSDSKSDKEKKKTMPAKASDYVNEIDFSILNVSDDHVAELKRVRAKNNTGKSKVFSQRMIDDLARQVEAAKSTGWTIDAIITEWEVRGWKSFKAEWLKQNSFTKPSKHDLSQMNYQSGKL